MVQSGWDTEMTSADRQSQMGKLGRTLTPSWKWTKAKINNELLVQPTAGHFCGLGGLLAIA